MNKFFLGVVTLMLVVLSACHKQEPASSNNDLSVNIDGLTGSVSYRHSGDTVQVDLSDLSRLSAVPLNYNIAHDAVADSGVRTSAAGLWNDTVDLSNNKVSQLTVTAANGAKRSYVIVFRYITEVHSISSNPYLTTNDLFFKGDSLYAATSDGLYLSTDGAVSWTKLPGVNTEVICVYAKGSNVYAGTADGLETSSDGGLSFSMHIFESPRNGYKTGQVNGIDVQGDTVFAATMDGVYISPDRGSNWNRVSPGAFSGMVSQEMLSVVARGDRVYIGIYGGLYASSDGGKTFVAAFDQGRNSNLVDVNFYSLAIQDGVVYSSTNGVLMKSTDGGRSFVHAATIAECRDIFVEGKTICVASLDGLSGGIAVSRDGGMNFSTYGYTAGLPGTWGTAVTMKGDIIYGGFNQKGSIGMIRPR